MHGHAGTPAPVKVQSPEILYKLYELYKLYKLIFVSVLQSLEDPDHVRTVLFHPGR
jgi:hypothetical protein